MARRSRSRQIEIFNFSFLDILACTIGLLIFIMVMVFVLQSNSPVANTDAAIRRTSKEVQRQRTAAARDTAMAQQLEDELGRIHDSVKPELGAARDLAARQAHATRADYDATLSRLHAIETELDTARQERQQKSESDLQNAQKRLKEATNRNAAAKAAFGQATDAPMTQRLHFLPVGREAGAASDQDILYVDCRADSVAILTDSNGYVHEQARFPVSDVSDNDSAFRGILAKQARMPHPLVLLWVRPDGMATFEQVRQALPENLPFGYEPADAEWRFSPASKP